MRANYYIINSMRIISKAMQRSTCTMTMRRSVPAPLWTLLLILLLHHVIAGPISTTTDRGSNFSGAQTDQNNPTTVFNSVITAYNTGTLPAGKEVSSLQILPHLTGILLDVELHALKGYDRNNVTSTQLRLWSTLKLFQDCMNLARNSTLLKTLPVTAAIPFWYDGLEYISGYVNQDGTVAGAPAEPITRSYHELIIDILDGINIMAYRNDPSQAARMPLVFMDYAKNVGKRCSTTLETMCPPEVPATVTFCNATSRSNPDLSSDQLLEMTVDNMYTNYGSYSSFEDVAIHYYESWIPLVPEGTKGSMRPRAMYVWRSETILYPELRQQMLNFSLAHSVNKLYLFSEYILPLCGHWDALRETIKAAGELNITSSILLGQPQWVFNYDDALRYFRFLEQFISVDGECNVPLYANCSGSLALESSSLIWVNATGVGNVRIQRGDSYSAGNLNFCTRFDLQPFQSGDLDTHPGIAPDYFQIRIPSSGTTLSFWAFNFQEMTANICNAIAIPANSTSVDITTLNSCWVPAE